MGTFECTHSVLRMVVVVAVNEENTVLIRITGAAVAAAVAAAVNAAAAGMKD